MYNANPNYEMNFAILKDVNEHMEGCFNVFLNCYLSELILPTGKTRPVSGIPVSTVCVWKYTVYLAKPRRCWQDITGLWNIHQTKGFIFILSATWMDNVTRNLIGYPGNWEISGGGSRKGMVIFICAGLKTNTRCVSIT